MLPKYTEDSLDAAIAELENRQIEEAKQLKLEFNRAVESLKPANLIKSTLDQVKSSTEIKGNLMNAALGLGAGILTKKVFVSLSHSPIKRLIGEGLLFGMTNLVVKNPTMVKTIGLGILKLLKRKTPRKTSSNGHEVERETIFWT